MERYESHTFKPCSSGGVLVHFTNDTCYMLYTHSKAWATSVAFWAEIVCHVRTVGLTPWLILGFPQFRSERLIWEHHPSVLQPVSCIYTFGRAMSLDHLGSSAVAMDNGMTDGSK